ncbi:hypothetical protein ACS0TY_023109 [Phlomoides rotata]
MKLLPVYVTLLLTLFLLQGSQVSLAKTCYKKVEYIGLACSEEDCNNVCQQKYAKEFPRVVGICMRAGNICNCVYPC